MSARDVFPGLDAVRAERALRALEQAAREAREFFEAGHFDAAQTEVDRCRRAVRTLDEIRREQTRTSRSATPRAGDQKVGPA